METRIKTIFRAILLLVIAFNLTSCSDDDDEKVETVAFTTTTIHGTWQLTQWNGQALTGSVYCYIDFDRSYKTFKMYQNFDSMYARCITGSFSIEKDNYVGDVISGKYDFDNGAWNHDYIVTGFDNTTMTWTAKDDSSEVSVYQRCDEIPQDIISQARDEFSSTTTRSSLPL